MSDQQDRLDNIIHILAITGSYQDSGQTAIDGGAVERAKADLLSWHKEECLRKLPKKFDRATMVEASKKDYYIMHGFNQCIDEQRASLEVEEQ